MVTTRHPENTTSGFALKMAMFERYGKFLILCPCFQNVASTLNVAIVTVTLHISCLCDILAFLVDQMVLFTQLQENQSDSRQKDDVL